MSQESLVFVMGALVVLTPFLGVPNTWKEWILTILGALIIVFSYRMRRARYLRSLETAGGERHADAFVENKAPIVAAPLEDI